MTNQVKKSQQPDKRKALLMAKIYAERELIGLQGQRLIYDVKPSTIKNNLFEGAVERFDQSRSASRLFAYVDRHPAISWAVAQLLRQGVKRSRSSLWRPLAFGLAAWFVNGRKRAIRREAARKTPLTGPRVRAHSMPLKAEDEALYLGAAERAVQGTRPDSPAQRQRVRRRLLRRRS